MTQQVKLPAGEALLKNQGLLRKIVHKVIPKGDPELVEDLMQELQLAFLEAYPKWDPARGKLSTYMYLFLTGRALRAYRLITIPVSLTILQSKMRDTPIKSDSKSVFIAGTHGKSYDMGVDITLEYMSNLTKAEKHLIHRHLDGDKLSKQEQQKVTEILEFLRKDNNLDA